MNAKRIIIIIAFLVVVSLFGYWSLWSRGFVIASTSDAQRGRFVIREIPHSRSLLGMVLGTTGYSYRLEFWRWPHFMHDCRTYTEDSYRARFARIIITPEGCDFDLDDHTHIILTPEGEWRR